MRTADRLVTVIGALIDREYAVGDRLPSETELAEICGRSRPTVRDALARLQADGIVERRWGAGTFVRQLPGRVADLTLPTVHGIRGRFLAARLTPSIAQFEATLVPSPSRWWSIHGVGDVWRVERVFAADGEPTVRIVDLMPCDLQGVPVDPRVLVDIDVLVNDVFIRAGSALARVELKWRAELSDAETTTAFDLAAPEPVMAGNGIGYAPDGTEITITSSTHRTNIIPLTTTVWGSDQH